MTETITITLDANDATVKAVVAQIKSDMRGGGRYARYVEEYSVTKENLNGHALALARLVTPETAQTENGGRTKFGNAVQAAKTGLGRALPKSSTDTDWMNLVRQAASNAHTKGEFSADAIIEAVEAVFAESESDAA